MKLGTYLEENRLLCDGAFGTYFAQQGYAMLPEEASLRMPSAVKAIHREYIRAGARLIRTNTFACYPAMMGGRERQQEAICAAAALAREAVEESGRDVFVAGDIGPAEMEAMHGNAGQEDPACGASEAYERMLRLMLDEGIRIFFCETLSDDAPLLEALERVLGNSAVRKDVFVLLQFSVNQQGYTEAGLPIGRILTRLGGSPLVDAVGLNCGVGPGHMSRILSGLALPEGKWISALPNASYPHLQRGRVVFQENHAYFAEKMTEMSHMGADILGGCCGTTPETIRRIRETVELQRPACPAAALHRSASSHPPTAPNQTALAGRSVRDSGQRPRIAVPQSSRTPAQPQEQAPTPTPAQSQEQLPAQPQEQVLVQPQEQAPTQVSAQPSAQTPGGAFYAGKGKEKKLIAVELAPPFHADDRKLLEAAARLAEKGVDVATYPDSPSGRTRADSVLTAVKSACSGLCVMPHICCRDKNAIALRAQLLGAYLNGIRNLLVITGDPVPTRMRGAIRSVFPFDSVGLMQMIREMNEEEFTEDPVVYGGAINQGRRNLDVEIERVKKKSRAGASFFLSQPLFTREEAQRLLHIRQSVPDARILCGIMPLVSWKNALFIRNEMAGIQITDDILARYREDMSKEEGEAAGAALAREVMEMTAPFVDGYYFSLPFNRVSLLDPILQD